MERWIGRSRDRIGSQAFRHQHVVSWKDISNRRVILTDQCPYPSYAEHNVLELAIIVDLNIGFPLELSSSVV